MNRRQLILAGLFCCMISCGLGAVDLYLEHGGSGAVAPAGVQGSKILFTYDIADKPAMVAENRDYFDSSEFHVWMETMVDKTPDGVTDRNWKVLPNTLTFSDDAPQWKALASVAKGKNSLTVTKNGKYWTWDLPPDDATAKSLIQQRLP